MIDNTYKKIIEKYTCCPKCKGSIVLEENKIYCGECNKMFSFFDKTIPDFFEETSENTLSLEKWEEVFQSEFFQNESEKEFRKFFLKSAMEQVLETSSVEKGVYLEIGCGQGILGEELAKKGWFFIGVDYSKAVLRQLKIRLEKNGVKNYLLIRADIEDLPIKKDTVNLIFGGGVLEHIKKYDKVISHLYRVLVKGGVSVNTVPMLNIGNFFYRSLWGGIPNIPVIKQIAEFIHIKLLGGKHMVFGYELQFSESQLIKMHLKAGFTKNSVTVENYRVKVQLHHIKNAKIQKFFRRLCETNKNFWPMAKVIAKK